MAILKCNASEVLKFGLMLFVMGTTFTVFITLLGAYKQFSWSIDCNPLNPNLPSPIFNTDCIRYNDTEILVKIINCANLTDVGFLISSNNQTTFKTTQSCWYSGGDVNCTMLTSNSLNRNNMTVAYSLPIEMKMWDNYEKCLKTKKYWSDAADSIWVGAGTAAAIVIFYSAVMMLYYCNWDPCKKKNQENLADESAQP